MELCVTDGHWTCVRERGDRKKWVCRTWRWYETKNWFDFVPFVSKFITGTHIVRCLTVSVWFAEFGCAQFCVAVAAERPSRLCHRLRSTIVCVCCQLMVWCSIFNDDGQFIVAFIAWPCMRNSYQPNNVRNVLFYSMWVQVFAIFCHWFRNWMEWLLFLVFLGVGSMFWSGTGSCCCSNTGMAMVARTVGASIVYVRVYYTGE